VTSVSRVFDRSLQANVCLPSHVTPSFHILIYTNIWYEVSSLFIASNHNITKVIHKLVLMLRKLMTVLTGNVLYS